MANDTMDLDIICKYCNTKQTVSNIDCKDYENWFNGEGFIQDILPYLSVSDRELLMSRTCDTCWNKMFQIENIDYESKETTE